MTKNNQLKVILIGIIKPDRANFNKPLVKPLFYSRESASLFYGKPKFRSGFEKRMHSILCDIFSPYLVFSNLDLFFLFNRTELRLHLTPRERKFLSGSSHVDFCIANRDKLIPFLGIEIDSQFHFDDVQKRRDKIKNRIFRIAGVPLLRIHPANFYHESWNDRRMKVRAEMIEAIRQIGGRYDMLAKRISLLNR